MRAAASPAQVNSGEPRYRSELRQRGGDRPTGGAGDQARLVEEREDRPALPYVEPHRLEAIEHGRAGEPGEPELEGEVAPDEVAQRSAALVERARARDLEAHQGLEGGRGRALGAQLPLVEPEVPQILVGEVDDVAVEIAR